jgi:hypothetical protein
MKSPIAIDAALAAMSIIVSSVKGADDINQKTNFSIRDIKDVSLHTKTVRYTLENPSKAESPVLSARKYVGNKHTPASFALNFFNTKSYSCANSLSCERDYLCAV